MAKRTSIHKNALWVFLGILLILMMADRFAAITSPDARAYQTRSMVCLEYLEDGTIYGGQPSCEQGPMYYWTGWAVHTLVGEELFHRGYGFFRILLHIAIIGLIITLLGLTRVVDRAFLCVVYYAILYKFDETPTTLAIAFILGAMVLLFKSEHKYKHYFAGACFALAIFSKFTALIALVFVLAVYFSKHISIKKASLRLRNIKALKREPLEIAVPLVGLLFAIKLIYPNVFIYALHIHQYLKKFTIPKAVGFILTINPLANKNYLLVVGTLIVGAFIFWRTRSKYSALYVLTTLATCFALTRNNGEFPRFFGSYYVLIALAFLVIMLADYFAHATHKDTKKAYIVLGLLALFLITIMPLNIDGRRTFLDEAIVHAINKDFYESYDTKREQLRTLVEAPFKVIDLSNSTILMNSEIQDVFEKQGIDVTDYANAHVRDNTKDNQKYLDTWYVPGLEAHGLLVEQDLGINEHEIALAQEISTGTYDGIIVGPKQWDTMIMYALKEVDQNILGQYCSVTLPTLLHGKNGRHWSTAIFKNHSHCLLLLGTAKQYYEQALPQICSVDQWAGEYVVRSMFARNGAQVEAQCAGGGNFVAEFEAVRGKRTEVPFGLILFYILVFTASGYYVYTNKQ